tara:strand:+ start:1319 stop:1645 length:327 start_codon:yes stop_codon:yes gene_type:complete
MKNLLRYSFGSLVIICAITPNAFAQLRDPTQPTKFLTSLNSNTQSSELKLQTIIKSSATFKAIISGRIYQVNDVVDDFRVLSISSKQVVLANNDKQIKLELYDYEIKK